VADGLPGNALSRVLVRPDGYLWICSFDGLARFDGLRFEPFRTREVPALGSNRIVACAETADGLWVVSEVGRLVRYREGHFEVVAAPRAGAGRFLFLRQDRGGRLLVGSEQGVFRAGPAGLEAVGPALAAPRRLVDAAVDARGDLWLATTHGAGHLRQGRLRWLPPAGPVHGIAEWGRGMLFFVEGAPPLLWRDEEWREVPGDGAGLLGRAHAEPLPWGGDLVVNRGRTFFHLRDGRLEPLATAEVPVKADGVAAVDATGDRWLAAGSRIYRNGEPVFDLGPGIGVRSLAVDGEGTVWLATAGDGLHALRRARVGVIGAAEGLPVENVYAVYEDRARGLWIGTHGAGLWRLADGRLTPYPVPGDPSRVPFARAVTEDADGTVWVGGLRSLRRVEGGVLVADSAAGAPSRVQVNALLPDRQGRLWVATDDGLYCRLPGRGAGAGAAWRRLGPPHLPHPDVRTLAEDPRGGLWIGTAAGVVHHPLDGRRAVVDRSHGLPSDLVRSLLMDSRGMLWIGTEDGGLARLDPRTLGRPGGPEVLVLDTARGLAFDGIHHVVEDDLGNLWMSGNRGIAHLRRQQVEAFAAGEVPHVEVLLLDERDGMPSREANGGSADAGLLLHDGRVAFATQGGVVVIDPAVAAHRDPPPPVRLESLEAGLPRRLTAGAAPVLGRRERSFSIRYTAPAFRAPESVRFRYRLEGFDAAWLDAGTRREAFYTRVPPGRYRFVVAARHAAGAWGEEAALPLTVEPLFQESLWFHTLAAFTAAVAIAGVVLTGQRRQRRRRRGLERVVAERTAEVVEQAAKLRRYEQRKANLVSDLSHELRTPLAQALSPLQDLLDGRAGRLDPEAEGHVRLALRNGRRILALVDQLSDVARLEAGWLRLRVREVDLAALADECIAPFRAAAEARGIELACDRPPDPLPLWIDRAQMHKVLDNLLAHALETTPAGGAVRMRLGAVDARWARIEVRASADRPPGPVREGIGLAVAREVATLHGGRFAVDGAAGEGTISTVHLRRGRGHFTPEVLDAASAGGAVPEPNGHAPGAPLAVDPAPVEVTPADEAFVARVRAIVEESLEDPDFGVARLADALGCDRTYLFRRLRDLLQETPSGLIRRLRLARARQLLGGRAGGVGDVAGQVGFKSVSHVTRCFRERYGCLPSVYASAPPRRSRSDAR
jgi:ligand-binding sensor domain-containing protein/signal transduction histidine kinase/AraC-like DNA-binding protein